MARKGNKQSIVWAVPSIVRRLLYAITTFITPLRPNKEKTREGAHCSIRRSAGPFRRERLSFFFRNHIEKFNRNKLVY